MNPPPAAGGQDLATGAWLALGAALVMFAGAVLTLRPRLVRGLGRGSRRARAGRGGRPPAGHDGDRGVEGGAAESTERATD